MLGSTEPARVVDVGEHRRARGVRRDEFAVAGPCGADRREVDDSGVARCAGDTEAETRSGSEAGAAETGTSVDGTRRRAAGRCRGVGSGVDRAEVVGDEADSPSSVVDEADVAVGADAGDGDVGVDGARRVVDVGEHRRARGVRRDELSVSGRYCADGRQVDDCSIRGRPGDAETRSSRRFDAVGDRGWTRDERCRSGEGDSGGVGENGLRHAGPVRGRGVRERPTVPLAVRSVCGF